MNHRILSIDIFRGITIAFMIIVNSPGSWNYVYSPLKHASWHGCTAADLVFPFFIFAVGLSMAFSMNNLEQKSKPEWTSKILKRTLLIFVVGFLLNWFPFYNMNALDVRFFGVLQRIALSYGIAALLILFIQKQNYLISTIVLGLIGYNVLMKYGGDFSLENNLNKKVDSFFLPAKNLYGGFGTTFDPEGLLGAIPSALQVIIGFLIGKFIINTKAKPIKSIMPTFLIGSVFVVLAYYVIFRSSPINKPLWTYSYVIYSSGLACMSLALIVYIVDVLKFQNWSIPFKVFGRNALFSYVLSIAIVKVLTKVVKFEDGNGYSHLYSNVFQPAFGDYPGSLAFALFVLSLVYIGAYSLYKKNIMIKL